MKYLHIVTVIFTSLFCESSYGQDPNEILQRTTEKLGGMKRIQNVDFIRRHYNGHKHWIEQSEHHNGPFITSYEEVNETYGLKKELLNQTMSAKQIQFPKPILSTTVINEELGEMVFGEAKYPIPHGYRDEIIGIIRYDPYFLIQQAHLAKDLELKVSSNAEQETYYILYFTEECGRQIALWLDGNNYLLKQAEIETVLPYENFFSPFGNFNTTVKYSLYGLFEKGYRYPQQFDIYRLNRKWRSFTIDKIEFEPEMDTVSFTTSEKAPGFPKVVEQKANPNFLKEIGPNIFAIKGQWNVHWIEEEEGVYIVESPISSSYSKSIIKLVRSKYPLKPIKGVIVASDAYPHIAGIREYVAEGITIYTHKNNQGILNEIIQADYRTYPDSQELKPKQPDFVFIDAKTNLSNQLAIFPVQGSAGSSMLMVYDGKERWLYTADLVQKLPDGSFFMPHYLSEVTDAVQREEIHVKTISGMHLDKMQWSDIPEYLKTLYQ